MMAIAASAFSVRKLWHLMLMLATTTRIDQVSAYAVQGLFNRSRRSRTRIKHLGDLIASQRGWNKSGRQTTLYGSSTATNGTPSVNGTSFFAGHFQAVLDKPTTTTTGKIQQPFATTMSALAVPPSSIMIVNKPKNNADSGAMVARHIFSCLFCFSAGFGDVRAIRNFGGPVNMCTGGIVRAVLAVMEGKWREVWTPTLLVTFYVLGAVASRLTQKVVDFQHQQQAPLPHSPSRLLRLSQRSSSSSNMSTLCWAVIPLILGAFGVATWKHQCLRTCIAAQAFGFGLIHTTVQEVTGGSVVFAVTGHVMAASRLAVDMAASKLAVDTATAPSPLAIKALLQRLSMIFSFAAGIVVAALLWDYVLPLLGAPNRLEHIMMGAWYSIIFAMCSRWV
jgi:uncharacterized membrane protein YoaK (UPF0700 family)